jgi:hypothetical protein
VPLDVNAILAKLIDFCSKNAGVFFTALMGTFFGAVSAYWTERTKERRKKRVEEHGAIIRAQMALIGQLNTVRAIQTQHLEPFRDDPQRVTKLISFEMSDTSLRVPYDAISFLLMAKDANLVLEVHAAEQSYFSVMEVLSARNKAQDALHKNSRVETFNPQTGACTIVINDPRNLKLLKDFTDALYTAADNARDRLTLQIQELEKAGKRAYPKKKFLKIVGKK